MKARTKAGFVIFGLILATSFTAIFFHGLGAKVPNVLAAAPTAILIAGIILINILFPEE